RNPCQKRPGVRIWRCRGPHPRPSGGGVEPDGMGLLTGVPRFRSIPRLSVPSPRQPLHTMTVLQPSFEEFTSLASSGNLIPVWTALAADYETPVSVFQKLSENQRTPSFLLESAENSEQIGRYSFLGTNPRLEIRCHGRTLSLREQGQSEFVTRELPPSE